ncbi:SPASM domain-containing protein [candidate division KSB1 bacterium]|nr:SPASM domain-containing protein [candidate division KSB1 bacterium]
MLLRHAPMPRVIVDTERLRGQVAAIDGADCACPLSISPRHRSDHAAPLKFDQLLHQTPATQWRGPADYTVFASTHADAGIALLNAAALNLWQRFEVPRSPNAALHQLGIETKALHYYHEALVDLCWSGFLRDAPNTPIPLAREDTLIAWLHTTNACNLRCNYCYLAKTNEMMDEQIGRQSIDAIFRSAFMNDFQKVKIKYAGGEATLNFGLVTKLHDYARQLADEQNISLSGVVLSNGVRLTPEMIKSMLARQLRLMISLDGLGVQHDAQRHFANGRGSFDMVTCNIEMAKDQGLVPDICITVSGRSAAGLPDLIGWILDRDLPFSLNFYRENELSASFADLQLDEERIINGMLAAFKVIEANLPRRSLLASLVDRANLSAPHSRPCAAGHNYLVIDHFGRVAKCQMEMNKPITNIAVRDPLAVIRSDQIGVQNYTVEEKEGCRDCEWKYWCTGGCPQATFRATGRYDIQSPNCRIYKTLYPEVVRLEALRLLKSS